MYKNQKINDLNVPSQKTQNIQKKNKIFFTQNSRIQESTRKKESKIRKNRGIYSHIL